MVIPGAITHFQSVNTPNNGLVSTCSFLPIDLHANLGQHSFSKQVFFNHLHFSHRQKFFTSHDPVFIWIIHGTVLSTLANSFSCIPIFLWFLTSIHRLLYSSLFPRECHFLYSNWEQKPGNNCTKYENTGNPGIAKMKTLYMLQRCVT